MVDYSYRVWWPFKNETRQRRNAQTGAELWFPWKSVMIKLCLCKNECIICSSGPNWSLYPYYTFNCPPRWFFINHLKNHYLDVGFNDWYSSTLIRLGSGRTQDHLTFCTSGVCLSVYFLFAFIFSKRLLDRYITPFPPSSHRKPSQSPHGIEGYLPFNR